VGYFLTDEGNFLVFAQERLPDVGWRSVSMVPHGMVLKVVELRR
jgi:hypothetical protein